MVNKATRRKHIPQRTCVGCREVLSKWSLIRIVRRSHGVLVDPTGKMTGRGAYLHRRRSCWEKGLAGSLENALKAKLTTEEKKQLSRYIDTLPDEGNE